MKTSLLLTFAIAAAPAMGEDSTATAARVINSFGLDLLRRSSAAAENALLSPYSIQSALAMTYAGAAGDTHAEMAKVLHFPTDEGELHRSFAALRAALEDVTRRTTDGVGQSSQPVTLTSANRLFGQRGYNFRAPFLALVRDNYGAPLQELDFRQNPDGATRQINDWVEEQTHRKICSLIPPRELSRETALVLVNAIYLKAPWLQAFAASATQPRPFHVRGGTAKDVPMMSRQGGFGYAKRDGFCAVTIPYRGGDVQFLVLLPDEVNGLAALEARVTADLLAECAKLDTQEVALWQPKLKMEPPLIKLSQNLKALGMKTAFDDPPASANFDRMAPRRPDDYLSISEVLHKTFMTLDEKGTEAAAATAVVMVRAAAAQKSKPIEVRVDRPFLFAVQHRPSGACLFFGRVTDPR